MPMEIFRITLNENRRMQNPFSLSITWRRGALESPNITEGGNRVPKHYRRGTTKSPNITEGGQQSPPNITEGGNRSPQPLQKGNNKAP